MSQRRALIKTQDARAVARYLPSNYVVLETTEAGVLISGKDNAGWTLDDYVLPRLASGLYFGEEVTA
jgi:hypothetical protein